MKNLWNNSESLEYIKYYKKYFKKYRNNILFSIISDPLPRIIIVEGLGYFSIGRNTQEEKISSDSLSQ